MSIKSICWIEEEAVGEEGGSPWSENEGVQCISGTRADIRCQHVGANSNGVEGIGCDGDEDVEETDWSDVG